MGLDFKVLAIRMPKPRHLMTDLGVYYGVLCALRMSCLVCSTVMRPTVPLHNVVQTFRLSRKNSTAIPVLGVFFPFCSASVLEKEESSLIPLEEMILPTPAPFILERPQRYLERGDQYCYFPTHLEPGLRKNGRRCPSVQYHSGRSH